MLFRSRERKRVHIKRQLEKEKESECVCGYTSSQSDKLINLPDIITRTTLWHPGMSVPTMDKTVFYVYIASTDGIIILRACFQLTLNLFCH